jgi:uncharacterized protein
VKLTVKIIPNAKKSEIIGWEDGKLKIKIKCPPVDGKANKELISFLSKEWGISKSQIILLKGEKNKLKVLEIPDDTGIRVDT